MVTFVGHAPSAIVTAFRFIPLDDDVCKRHAPAVPIVATERLLWHVEGLHGRPVWGVQHERGWRCRVLPVIVLTTGAFPGERCADLGRLVP